MEKLKTSPKIIIVASNPIIIEGISTIIRKTRGLKPRGLKPRIILTNTPKEALKVARQDKPDIIFVSEEITSPLQKAGKSPYPSPTPFELCRKIKNGISPSSKIIIFSVSPSREQKPAAHENPVYEAARCGADGYLPPNASLSDTTNALKSILRGEVFLTVECAAKLMESVRKNPYETTSLSRLSPVEIKILKLAARGFSNKKIARKLKNSTHTIKNHLSSIISKLGATTRTNAVAIAINKGFIPF